MVKVAAFDAADAGLVMVTDAVPAAARSEAGMATLRCVASVRVVVRGAPFQFTVAPGTRLLPVTVMRRLPAPWLAVVMFTEARVGFGFCCRSCGTTKGPRAR